MHIRGESREISKKEEGEEFFVSYTKSLLASKMLTRRNREVINFTRSYVKNNSKLTNLMK